MLYLAWAMPETYLSAQKFNNSSENELSVIGLGLVVLLFGRKFLVDGALFDWAARLGLSPGIGLA